jgi:hypothetical protein
MARSSDVLLWDESKEVELLSAIANVQPSIDGLLANAAHLDQVACRARAVEEHVYACNNRAMACE